MNKKKKLIAGIASTVVIICVAVASAFVWRE